mmetsp:Transcript_21396/g.29944  ORF Transcript_21396/g.29944 Transcript_21396/m.29944 type:complete len:135 (-) Transcript_21396:106-510(-)
MWHLGYPQITAVEILKSFIRLAGESRALTRQEAKIKKALTKTITGVNEWRPNKDLVYEKNEVFIDALESVNVLQSTKGNILRADVTGQVIMKTKLSGTPTCKFGMNDKVRLRKEASEGKLRRAVKVVSLDDVTL